MEHSDKCQEHMTLLDILETNTIGIENKVLNVDVIETTNYFSCIEIILLTMQNLIEDRLLVWDYKKYLNEVDCMETTLPKEVVTKMKALLSENNFKKENTFGIILDFSRNS